MEEQATTGSSSTDVGAQTIDGIAVDPDGNALPNVEVEETTADTPTSDTSDDSDVQSTDDTTDTGADALPEAVDDKLATFAKGQGIEDVSSLTKREVALLKSAYDNKAAFDRQRTSELNARTAITDDQVSADASPEQRENIRLRNVELQLEVSNWKQNNPDKLAQESAMVETLADPNKRLLFQEGYLTLDDLYHMARGRTVSDVDIKQTGKREALVELADKQQAAVPRGSAVNGLSTNESKITPQNVDRMVANMTPEEYKKRLPEINQALAS